MLSKKIAQILFGSYSKLEGGTPIRATLENPQIDGTAKFYRWEGNKGLIVTMLERIEKLEEEVKSKAK